MDDAVERAFRAIPREHFLPDDEVGRANVDVPLPIGFGSTNSQPSTVALMLRWLAVEPGNKILDVGSGSGWTCALLAWLTGKRGKVVAVEIVPYLVAFGRHNCDKLRIKNVTFHQAGKQVGWPEEAPYDRILVSAAARSLPQELPAQLANGGRLIVPIQSCIIQIDKDKSGQLDQREYPGFAFVPLI
jgi:protein-L-isoaspartate(D-aspartate) O-methyltransferase